MAGYHTAGVFPRCLLFFHHYSDAFLLVVSFTWIFTVTRSSVRLALLLSHSLSKHVLCHNHEGLTRSRPFCTSLERFCAILQRFQRRSIAVIWRVQVHRGLDFRLQCHQIIPWGFHKCKTLRSVRLQHPGERCPCSNQYWNDTVGRCLDGRQHPL